MAAATQPPAATTRGRGRPARSGRRRLAERRALHPGRGDELAGCHRPPDRELQANSPLRRSPRPAAKSARTASLTKPPPRARRRTRAAGGGVPGARDAVPSLERRDERRHLVSRGLRAAVGDRVVEIGVGVVLGEGREERPDAFEAPARGRCRARRRPATRVPRCRTAPPEGSLRSLRLVDGAGRRRR